MVAEYDPEARALYIRFKRRKAARRLIAQGAVDIDGEKVAADGPADRLKPGAVVRVGKHKFVKVE